MNFSKYKKSIIACVLALGIGVGGGYYFFGSPVTHQTTVREQTKQSKPITETRNTYVVQAVKESGPAVVVLLHKCSKRISLTVPSMLGKVLDLVCS